MARPLVRMVPRYPESARERFLSADELARLGRALRDAELPGLPWREREGAKTKHLGEPRKALRADKVRPRWRLFVCFFSPGAPLRRSSN